MSLFREGHLNIGQVNTHYSHSTYSTLVSPLDSIEEMIMQQNPILEGSNVQAKTIKEILEHQSEKCLLLLDGYDEMPDNIPAVTKLLEKRSYPKCNIILTSRPNTVTFIQKYFSTVASVEGFSREKAKECIEKILLDKHMRDAVMEYSETNEIVDMWRYPILVLFLCLLVNHGKIDIEHGKLTLSDLYTCLHELLYQRYIEKVQIPFNEEEKEKIFLKLGKIALYGITNQRHGFQKSFVIKEVGEEIFKYGILIADTDKRLLAKDDVCVFFPHKTIQEFLAAKYLVTEAQDGNTTVKKLIGKQNRKIVQENLMFFLFALDFSMSLSPRERKKYFTWHLKVSEQLKEYMHNEFQDCLTIDIKSIAFSGQSSNILIGQIARCTGIANLKFERIRFDNSLASLLRQMSNLITIRFTDCSYLTTAKQSSKEMDEEIKSIRNITVTNTFKQNRNADLVEMLLTFQYQSLTMFDFSYCNLTGNALQCLSSANAGNHLPKLTGLHLHNNPGISGSLFNLFHTVWYSLEKLNVASCNLSDKDVECVFREFNKCIPKWKDIKLFSEDANQTWFLSCLKEPTHKDAFLQSLRETANLKYCISHLLDHDEFGQDFKPRWAEIEVLNLKDWKLQAANLRSISKGNALGNMNISKLILQKNHNVSTNLHELFHKSVQWKSLIMLDCSMCNLHKTDLVSLSDANAAGYLPVLKHFELCFNRQLGGNLTELFHKPTPWKLLEMLEFTGCDLQVRDLISLSEANTVGYLPMLRHLDLRDNTKIQENIESLLTQGTWASLEILGWGYINKSGGELLLLAIKDGRFPKLHTVRISCYHDEMPKGKLTKHVKFEY